MDDDDWMLCCGDQPVRTKVRAQSGKSSKVRTAALERDFD